MKNLKHYKTNNNGLAANLKDMLVIKKPGFQNNELQLVNDVTNDYRPGTV
jgi:hypothetical protein